jgi:hypothetical protein
VPNGLAGQRNERYPGRKGGHLKNETADSIGLYEIFKVAVHGKRSLSKSQTLVDDNQVVQRGSHEDHSKNVQELNRLVNIHRIWLLLSQTAGVSSRFVASEPIR